MTESLSPRSYKTPEIRFQPSMLSVPSAANTVAPPQAAPADLHREPKPTAWRQLWFFTALSAFVGTAAAGALGPAAGPSAHVHSGKPGFKQSGEGHELLWKQPTVTVHLDDSLSKLGPQGSDAVVQAFGQWLGSDRKLPALSFDTVRGHAEPKQDGKNTVSYSAIKVPGHEHDVAITITYANDKTGEIVEADVVLNARYSMGVLTPKAKGPGSSGKADEAMDCQNRYDAQNVVTHEAGHFFGLGEDMTERDSTMFLSIDQCETHKRLLSSSDVGALTTLYAANEAPEQSGGSAAGCSFGGAPLGRGAVGVFSALFALGLLRRRAAR